MTTSDPRRFGIGAAALCGVYAIDLFIPDALARVVVGSLGAVAAVALAIWTPLPRWKESDERKRLAAWAMAGEALAIAAIVTVVRMLVT